MPILVRRSIALAAICAAFFSPQSHPDDAWPQFRGPNGSAVSLSGNFPIHFGPNSNVVWKTALPSGHSSPCIWGNKIFLTGFAEGQLQTICLDRVDGKISWRRSLTPGRIERGASTGNPAASTPATDGQRVYVYFGAFGLAAYDFEGTEIWRKPLPVPVTQHGAGTSPIVADGRVVLSSDQDVDSYLLAVDAQTGKTIWKTARDEFRRGFSTPLFWPPDRPEVIVLPGTLRLVAYDFKTGAARWHVNGLPNEMVASPAAGDGLIFVAGWTPGAGSRSLPTFEALLEQGDRDHDGRLTREEAPPGPARQHFLYIDANKDGFATRDEWESIARIFASSENVLIAVRPGGLGDVTATRVLWKQKRGLPYVPSPLFYDHRVFLIKNGGLVSSFDAKTGRACYQEERIGVVGDYYSSPVAAAGKICVASQSGAVTILKSGETLEVLARNNLGEPIIATPAIVGETLYVRTLNFLYAFSEQP